MLEEKIEALTVAMNANTAALDRAYGTSHTETKRGPTDDKVAEKPTTANKKKTSKKKTAKKTAAVEPAVPESPLTADKVQTHLRGIASQLTDTSKLFALIQQHGGQQFSDLDPSVYAALIADAEQLVADGA